MIEIKKISTFTYLLILLCGCHGSAGVLTVSDSLSVVATADSLAHHTGSFEWKGKRVVFEGTSITHGVAASSESRNWVSIFSRSLGIIPVNKGFDGSTVEIGCVHTWNPDSVESYSPGSKLFLELGLNDIGQNLSTMRPDSFRVIYDRGLEKIMKSWPSGDVLILTTLHPLDFGGYLPSCGIDSAASGEREDQFNTVIKDLAAKYNCTLIDMNKATRGLTARFYAADKVHLNDLGHLFYASYLIACLK